MWDILHLRDESENLLPWEESTHPYHVCIEVAPSVQFFNISESNSFQIIGITMMSFSISNVILLNTISVSR